jgi:hypothetical protein
VFVLGFVTAGVIALYLWLRPPPAAAPPAPAAPAPAAAAPAAPVPPGEFLFEIGAGKVRGPLAMVVRQGEQVSLRVRSDVADELHVHGYDLSAPLPPDEQVALTFIAARAGRFIVELHGSHRELGALEVQPQ